MSIFKKKDGISVEDQLVEAISANEAFATQVEGLEAKVSNFKLQEKLSVAGSKIGFTGKVSDVMKEGVTYETDMEAMITSMENQGEKEKASFEKSGSEKLESGDNEEFLPKTQKEAFDHVANEYGLEGKEKVLKANSLYPKLFKEEN